MRTISDRANASRGLIGHYFSGRDDLLVQAHRHLCEKIGEKIAGKIVQPGLTHRDKLTAVAEVVFSTTVLTKTNARAFLAFWHAAATYPEIARNHERLYQEYRAQVTAEFEAAKQDGAPVEDARLAAFSLIALVDGFWLQLSLEKRLTRRDAVRACKQFINLQLAEQGQL